MSNRIWLLIGILLSLLSLTLSRSVFAQSGTDSSSCGPSVPEQPIPDDGRWLRICLLDPMAPEATTVTAVYLKYLIEHPDPNQLEVRLSREDVGIEQVVWGRGKTAGTNEFGKSGDLTAFHGAPSEGYWYLWMRDTIAGQNGWLKGASLAVEYAPAGPLPTLLSGTPGQPTSRRLPADVVPSQTPDKDLKPVGGNVTSSSHLTLSAK